VTPNVLHYRSLAIKANTKHERDSTILTAAPKKKEHAEYITDIAVVM
jgi:hypothetical protein